MSEWFDPVWKFLHIKALIPVFIIAAVITQIYGGYFRFWRGYFRSLKPEPSRVLIFVIMAGAAIWLAHLLDQPLADFAKNASGKPAEMIWNYGGEMGRSIWIFLALAFLFSCGVPFLRNLVFGAVLGTALTGLTAAILKWLVLRARPSSGLGAQSFFNWNYFGTDNRTYQSFPSGDVSIVAGACFFMLLAFYKKPWAVIFLLTPLATAFARMHWARHWASDTVAAMILGIAWASFLWGYEKYRRDKNKI